MLERDLKKELKIAIKTKDIYRKDALRMILGEIPRLNKKKDDEATKEEIDIIIRTLIKSELIRLKAAHYEAEKSEYLLQLRSFLPKMMTEEEIKTWIDKNIDFNLYKSKLQSIGHIMNHLKGKADGNVVRKLVIS